ncbi:MAG: hypothetical protein QOD41_2059 [Cryptosporangiaceae bacterium]|jgi:hypothetical protein|nr:hypothetical protein [Cryptosporangiaceae bacterium]
MLEALTGTGLATAAGLNAYIPLLIVGLLSRFTDLITLPDGWRWLQNPWVLGILGVLLAVEVVADKIPVVDHINDVVQTVVRPTAGGLVFGATSSAQTVTVSNPDSFFSHNRWVPVLGGIVLALLVHGTKAAARPVINGLTLGTGAPVASTIEDGVSVSVSLVAILLPVLVLFFLAGLIALMVWLARRRRARSRTRHPVPDPY